MTQNALCGDLSMLVDGTILSANGTFLSWTGRRAGEVVGRMRFADFLTAGGRIFHETHHVQLLLSQGWARGMDVDLVGADGRPIPVLITSLLRREGDTPPVIEMTLFAAAERREFERLLRESRDRERAARLRAERLGEKLVARNAELQHLAYTDPLTGVGNRRALEEALGTAVDLGKERGRSFSIGVVDVDRFKQINDTYGHEAGDTVLRVVAGRLRHALRQEDIIGRWGGEEFLFVVSGVDAPVMERITERARSAVAAEPVAFQDRRVPVTVSIGWASWEGDAPQGLVDRADRALYRAKQDGRDRVVGAGAPAA